MSCYFRHLRDIFEEAGIEVTTKNRKAIHAHIAGVVGDPEKKCPSTWRRVKEWIADREKRGQLVAALSQADS